MRLDQLAVICCVSCGTEDGLIKLAQSMWPNARACARCLAKWGAARLALLADQTLAQATPARATRALPVGKCLHCSEPTLANADGSYNAWCTRCEQERRRLITT